MTDSTLLYNYWFVKMFRLHVHEKVEKLETHNEKKRNIHEKFDNVLN